MSSALDYINDTPWSIDGRTREKKSCPFLNGRNFMMRSIVETERFFISDKPVIRQVLDFASRLSSSRFSKTSRPLARQARTVSFVLLITENPISLLFTSGGRIFIPHLRASLI